MYQNYNYYPQQQPQMQGYPPRQQIQSTGLKGRPVSSLEEAKASIIDFDGSVFFFPDLANRKIYTKQINLDGTASLNMYELKEIPIENSNTSIPNNYITREEFEEAINQLKSNLIHTSSEQQKQEIKLF